MNKTTMISNARTTLEQLRVLRTKSTDASGDAAQTAEQWITALEQKLDFLAKTNHPVVLIGRIGVGKSSALAIATGLLFGPRPTDRASLKSNAVLATGSGRTTVCEVRISAAADQPELASLQPGQIALLIAPLSKDEITKEIEIYAEYEWLRQQPGSQQSVDDDSAPTAQEVQRALRGMTGYAEYQETFTENQIKKRRLVRPIQAAAAKFASAEAFAAHLLESAKLDGRTETIWRWDGVTAENLKDVKRRFEAINQGSDATAMLPKKMTIIVPEPLPGSGLGLDLTLVDTRGLDGGVESRGDLQQLLRDPRAAIVLCTDFISAPEDAIRDVLRAMASDAQLRPALARTMLLLLDQGDADQVNGADGEREYGQELKIDECCAALDGIGLGAAAPIGIKKSRILAFDALRDDSARLVAAIDDVLGGMRHAAERRLIEETTDAGMFLADEEAQLQPAMRAAVDQRLREAMAAHLPANAPMRDRLEGMAEAINATRYASVVYATCRRHGTYEKLDLYAATLTKASKAATAWLDGLINAVAATLDRLAQDDAYSIVAGYIRLRKEQYAMAQINVTREYAERVAEQIKRMLLPDSVWGVCRGEWGKGKGFKDMVLVHLYSWLRNQPGINAHETTRADEWIPLFREIARAAQAPRFSIHVSNFRALVNVDWTPSQLSVLIGANGSGKTTLLQIFKLLRVAYARGWPSAAGTTLLRGGGNLRSRGVAETEPIEIRIDLGPASWSIQLTPPAATITSERLTDQGREIFSCDGIGNLRYQREQIASGKHLGLRTLMERGAPDPAVRTMATLLQNFSVYHDPDLWSLRENGSNTADRAQLQPRGANVLAVLRRWSQEKDNRHRYQFVLDGLVAAFPKQVEDIGFDEAGNTLVAKVYPPGSTVATALADEANGFLQLLVLLCGLAGTEEGGVLAIDEPENSLHPYALRVFLDRAKSWAQRYKVTVLLATHSMVLLDELSATPENVYVMKAAAPGGPLPTRLDQLCERRWLEGFKLGDLYEQGEIGSNPDED